MSAILLDGRQNASLEIPDINTCSETYFLLTSLTAGSSAIITATSRLESMLRVHRVPYVALDVATNDAARNMWKRRGNGRKLPVVVFDGIVIGVSKSKVVFKRTFQPLPFAFA